MSNYPSRHLLFDPSSRERKARKILRILCDHLQSTCLGANTELSSSTPTDINLGDWLCLDVGCASGLISSVLADEFGSVVGLDVDVDALRRGEGTARGNLSAVVGDATILPFGGNLFDVVACSQVYEHVAKPGLLADEIWRVLRPGGICVFSGPNRLDPIERHYRLPFLHWMPRWLASVVLRLTRRGGSYEERPTTYWGLRRLLRKFQIYDYTVDMILDPVRYYCTDEVPEDSWARRVPRSVWRRLLFLLPNYNWVLVKPRSGRTPTAGVLWPVTGSS